VNIYLEQVQQAVSAVVIHSPTSYSWLGRHSSPLDRAVKKNITRENARQNLLYNLQAQLYADFYCYGSVRRPEPVHSSFLPGLTPFVQALSAANCGMGCREDGWAVCKIENEEIVAQKNGLQLRVPSDQCSPPEGSTIVPGMLVRVQLPKEFLQMSPGFYVALGNEQLTPDSASQVVRLYWNLTSGAAVPFTRVTTSLLNNISLPFHLKLLRNPDLYTRCDAAVLYILRKDYQAVVEVLSKIYAAVSSELRQGTPAFTKILAPGLALAESPASTQSFGEHRCTLLANAMVLAYEQGSKSMSDRMAAVVEGFRLAQLNLEAPFLNPNSSDIYGF
jgi:hypothetical protein